MRLYTGVSHRLDYPISPAVASAGAALSRLLLFFLCSGCCFPVAPAAVTAALADVAVVAAAFCSAACLAAACAAAGRGPADVSASLPAAAGRCFCLCCLAWPTGCCAFCAFVCSCCCRSDSNNDPDIVKKSDAWSTLQRHGRIQAISDPAHEPMLMLGSYMVHTQIAPQHWGH